VNYNQPNGWIHFALKKSGDSFVLIIENPTTDIPSDLLSHAFDRFYRGDASHARQVDGLGLGLSICAEIAKLHLGTLALEVGPQNTVVVTLNAPLKRVV
jgi:two-component system sensor histidine kinase MtrB